MVADLCLKLHPKDTVSILAGRADTGDTPLGFGVPLDKPVTRGHKIANTDIPEGGGILKFGQLIGYATRDIKAGEHVHVHNCTFGDHGRDYEIGADLETAKAGIPAVVPRTFMGYRRADGSAGTRNYIAICGTVNCSATVIRRAADIINHSGILDNYPHVDGVAAFAHGTGCGMANSGPGFDNLQRVLWGYATHPNVGAALFVGLGCEQMQLARMREIHGEMDESRFFMMTIQENGGTQRSIDKIVDHIKELLPKVDEARRVEIPVSELKLALQCGGSDGFSGITANPALGIASDLLVGMGGTVVLSETPEIYGAEQLLLRRAASKEVAEKLLARIKWWEEYTEANHGSMDNNPSPGNKQGGLTTILEKSLGAVAKAGSTPLMDVLEYGEQIREKGLLFMDTPGYDPVSATGQIAGGAQILCFTTGRGSAFGSKPTPTVKVATNSALFASMPDDMDLNCGDILSDGADLHKKGEELLDYLIATASGQKTKSEALGLGDNEFVPWQVGATM
ncbi:UxaA family hydrolase [Martelella sp. AD-3]|uniref:UxaA family hydrolase n=1 Tax=Martelella sp. AD-3 TaxID=686597 RepID=UPI0035270A44